MGLKGSGTEDCSVDAITQMSRDLIRYGVTSFFPTIYAQSEEIMVRAIEVCIEAMGQEEGALIAGIHIEGPFLSPHYGGAQRRECMREVDFRLLEKLFAAAKGSITTMTVAPELQHMRELALFCSRRGVILQAGHTNATYENMLEGMQVGIMHATHFCNAMSPLHHRDPGAVGAIMIHREMTCEIIADGYHVHPQVIRLLLREKPVEHIVLVTDSLRPTGQDEEPFFANGEEVYKKDGVFFRKKDDIVAGSSLTMIQGVRNMVSYGVPIEDVTKMTSYNPARIFGIRNKGSFLPGKDADVIVVSRDFELLFVAREGEVYVNTLGRKNK